MKLAVILSFTLFVVACTPPVSTSSTEAPSPSSESKASEEFNSAMEMGDFDRGVALLRAELEKPNPKPEVMFNMGLAYQQGAGVKEDLAEAARWFERAAAGGDADAQFNLGTLYSAGSGVPQSLEKAAALYRDAAVQGYSTAQYNLGRAYLAGEGVAENSVHAFVWLSLAESSTGPAAAPAQRTLARLSEVMSQEEIAAAMQAAERCRAPSFAECPEI